VTPLAMLLVPGRKCPPLQTAMCQSSAPEPLSARALTATESCTKHQGRRRALADPIAKTCRDQGVALARTGSAQ